MGSFAISFRVHQDSTYQARYDSLIEQIKKCRHSWLETTSLALVETTESLDTLEHRLYYDSKLLAERDLLFVVPITDEPAILRGKDRLPATLRAILPKAVNKT
jgi:hypothetical protein